MDRKLPQLVDKQAEKDHRQVKQMFASKGVEPKLQGAALKNKVNTEFKKIIK